MTLYEKLKKTVSSLVYTLGSGNVSNLSLVTGNVSIAESATIGPFCYLKAPSDGEIVIENGAEICSGTKIFAIRGSEVKIKRDSKIMSNSLIAPQEEGFSGKVELGENSVVHKENIIDISDDVIISKNVKTGRETIIHTHNHGTEDKNLIWENPVNTEPVKIGEGAWIGTRTQLMPGSELGRGSVLAAGAVLTKDTEEYVMLAGVPAEKKKER